MRDLKSKLLLNFINSKFQRSVRENKEKIHSELGENCLQG